MNRQRYCNLASWSHDEWKQLDIYMFIAANFTRYCTHLIKRIGTQHLPSDTTDSLLGIYCDVAWKPLKAVHEKNLDAEGERRNQIMLGTLKMITFTRMKDALIREFPNHLSLDQFSFYSDDECYHEDDGHSPHFLKLHDDNPLQRAFFAAEDHALSHEMQDQADSQEDERISTLLERMRSRVTPVQYRHLRYTICERMSTMEIAEHTGHSVTNARIVLLNARRKMAEMVPDELSDYVADCVLRK